MDLNATLVGQMTCVVTRSEAEIPSAGDRTTIHSLFNTTTALSGSSTPAVTKKYYDELTGNQSLDLTALADPELGDVDASGLKLQGLIINNLSTTATLTISDGAANPYQLNGGDDIVVPPGASFGPFFFNDQLADVAAGAKAIDCTITAGEDFQIGMLFG